MAQSYAISGAQELLWSQRPFPSSHEKTSHTMSTPVHGDVHEKDNDSISKVDVEAAKNQPYVAGKNLEQRDETGAKVNLHRGLSARQVQMIAIAGAIFVFPVS